MRVATWHGGTQFTIDTVPDPAPKPGEVVVAVHTAGICGSDVHATQGLFPFRPPIVMGHEYSGTVVALGRGASRRLAGRLVACEPNVGCGACEACRAGRISQCPRARRVGGFAEQVALPARNVHVLPDGVDPATASLAEPAACCLSGLEMLRMPREARVLVIGGGIMGLLTLAMARVRGAALTILSDPLEGRRDAARRLGADVVVDPGTQDLGAVVAEHTAGRGVDVACEAVGKPELLGQAVTLVRLGGIVQLVGVNPVGSRLPSDLFDLHFREVTLLGAYGRGTAFRRALHLFPRLGISDLVTERLPLARIREAFALASGGHGLKTAIAPGESG